MKNNVGLISWSDRLFLGDDNIDQEHKTLFDIAKKSNEIYSLADEQQKKDLLRDVVNELDIYVKIHFRNEEEYMQNVEYPELLNHKRLHSQMLDTLSFITLNLDLLSAQQAGEKLYNFVQNIFVKHMISEDTKIINFIKKS